MNIKGLRKFTEKVTAYVHGKTIPEVMKEYNLSNVSKFSSNENPYGPYPAAIEAMKKEVATLNSYPDSNYIKLKGIIGEIIGVDGTYVTLGHGAGGMIETIAKTFINEGDEVILPLQTYSLYKATSTIMGGEIKCIPLDECFCLDLKAFADAITPKTKLIWLCNPNNPTGTIFNLEDYEQLLDKLPEQAWIVLDEAYAEFTSPEFLPDSIKHIKEGKKVLVVRTFSKAYGLAGARLGYVIARPDVIQAIDTVALPFSSNRVSLVGALTTLTEDKECYEKCMHTIIQDRKRLTQELKDMGFNVIVSHANFVFLETPFDCKELTLDLLNRGIIVRPCAAWGYNNAIRITIGTTGEIDQLLKVFKKILEEKNQKDL